MRSAFEADTFAASALKQARRRQREVTATGAQKPISVAVRNHDPELAAVNTIRAADVLRF